LTEFDKYVAAQESKSITKVYQSMKQQAVTLIQELHESYKIQQKLDISDMIDFTN